MIPQDEYQSIDTVLYIQGGAKTNDNPITNNIIYVYIYPWFDNSCKQIKYLAETVIISVIM